MSFHIAVVFIYWWVCIPFANILVSVMMHKIVASCQLHRHRLSSLCLSLPIVWTISNTSCRGVISTYICSMAAPIAISLRRDIKYVQKYFMYNEINERNSQLLDHNNHKGNIRRNLKEIYLYRVGRTQL